MTAPNSCPTGCGRTVALGKLLCQPCWSQAPPDLKRQVVLAWAKHRELMRGSRTVDQVRISRATYEHAKDAAIASVG